MLDPAVDPTRARTVEEQGFRAAWVTETVRDPFLYLAGSATCTTAIGLGTAVAIAFARSPMTVALGAHDLQRLSGGRLLLGLGSQVRPHITRRFAMPWSHPAARMREYVQALRAIWACWNDGVGLDFRGEFYTHTLMTPFFDPGPNGHGPPPLLLGGVGQAMTAVAGQVAGGFLCGPLTSTLSLRQRTLPALAAGSADRSAELPPVRLHGMPLIVTGANRAETARVAAATRARIAFYASTPAYRDVLEVHGWEGLHEKLHALSKEARWSEMTALVDDEVLDAFAVVADPEDVGAQVRGRWEGTASRVILHSAHPVGDDVWGAVLAGFASPWSTSWPGHPGENQREDE